MRTLDSLSATISAQLPNIGLTKEYPECCYPANRWERRPPGAAADPQLF
jgi:hypothetical protein